jgi:hypothetical protein
MALRRHGYTGIRQNKFHPNLRMDSLDGSLGYFLMLQGMMPRYSYMQVWHKIEAQSFRMEQTA